MPKMLEDLVVVAKYNDDFLDGIASLGDRYPVVVMDTSGGGHPTGAYIRAYREHPAQNYLFIQDSMFAKQPDYLDEFKSRLRPGIGAVAWALFRQGFDNAEMEKWAKSFFGNDYPGIGIFGPVFYTSRQNLRKLEQNNWFPPIPTNKLEAQTTERMWSWAFYKAGFKLDSVGGWWDRENMINGTFPVFRKVFADRK